MTIIDAVAGTALERFLRRMEYPATRDDLLREASRDRISDEAVECLRTLGAGSFDGAGAVRHALRSRGLVPALAACREARTDAKADASEIARRRGESPSAPFP